MCQFISFFHHPQTGEILVSDLNSHGNTETALGLNPAGPYREGHYLPNGKIECRVLHEDGISQDTCNELLKSKYPTYTMFFNWCMDQVCKDGSFGGSLYLNSLTTAEGLKLPESVGGSLYLNSLTTAEGLKLPESVGGNLDLRGLTTAEGLKLPESVGGWLDLRGLTSKPKKIKLPKNTILSI